VLVVLAETTQLDEQFHLLTTQLEKANLRWLESKGTPRDALVQSPWTGLVCSFCWCQAEGYLKKDFALLM